MQNKLLRAWWVSWSVVVFGLISWYFVGGPKLLIPLTAIGVVVSIVPTIKGAPLLGRVWYAAMCLFAFWFLWQAFGQ